MVHDEFAHAGKVETYVPQSASSRINVLFLLLIGVYDLLLGQQYTSRRSSLHDSPLGQQWGLVLKNCLQTTGAKEGQPEPVPASARGHPPLKDDRGTISWMIGIARRAAMTVHKICNYLIFILAA